MKLLPVALNVAGKRCVVFGGGPVAARKALALIECGALVTAIAPQFSEDWLDIEDEIWQRLRVYVPGDCEGADLVFACTNDPEVNQRILEEARIAHVWCNVGDDPEAGDFHSAATVRHGGICVGITSGGAFPALSRHLKKKVEEAIGPEYEELVEIVAAHRAALPAKLAGQSERAEFWQAVLGGPSLQLLRDGKRAEAEKWIEKQIKNAK